MAFSPVAFQLIKAAIYLIILLIFVISVEDAQIIRLVDSSSGEPSAASWGNVQISLNNTWWFVCGIGWNGAKTRVACRELQHGQPLDYRMVYHSKNFTKNTLLFENQKCKGNEESIMKCAYDGWKIVTETECSLQCWIKCQDITPTTVIPTRDISNCESKEIRLSHSPSPNAGRLEVKHDGKWTIVYSTHWTDNEARIACQQLGYPTLVKRSSHFELHPSKSTENFVFHETTSGLLFCLKKAKVSQAGPIGQIGMTCEPDVRLVGLNQSNYGKLEVYDNGNWNEICSDTWTERGSTVICRQLGYSSVVSSYYSRVPEGFVPIWAKYAKCKGEEKELRQCSASPRAKKTCNGVVYIQCRGKDIRLTEYDVLHGGKVEILHKGVWGTVSSDKWDMAGAKVVCRELGYEEARKTLRDAEFPGNRVRSVSWLTDVSCKGNERKLVSCSHNNWKYHETNSVWDVGVLCTMNIRLTGSKNTGEGTLKVFHDHEWQMVCGSEWSLNEANVACRELGYENATTLSGLDVSPSNGRYVETDITCIGSESFLAQCQWRKWRRKVCKDGPVNLRCIGKEGEVRLLEKVFRNRFYNSVNIMHEGILGSVCADIWTMANAQVICRELDKPGAVYTLDGDNTYANMRGPIWLSGFNCAGNETRLIDCPHNNWLKLANTCTPKKSKHREAFVKCKKDTRLVGGKTGHGRAERYSKGVWSPVCVWDKATSRTFCLGLGFGGGKSMTVKEKSKICKTGNELYLECFPPNDIKLYNEAGLSHYGIIEMVYHASYFRINPLTFAPNYSRKICRRLGFPGMVRHWNFEGKQRRRAANIVFVNSTSYRISPIGNPLFWFKGLTCSKALRLVPKDDLNQSYYGRVELFWQGKWRSLLDPEWTMRDANVACHYLGYVDALDIIMTDSPNTTNSLLRHFDCKGNEGALTECPMHNISRKQNATTFGENGVGVRCKFDGEKICKACLCKNITVNCEFRQLGWMPWFPTDFHSETYRRYILKGNHIKEIKKFYLQEFFHLDTLDLSKNKISDLEHDLFEYSKQIVHLNLSDNLIEIVNKMPLGDLVNLQVLDISKNYIKQFDETVLDGMKNLKELYIDRFTHCCYAKKKLPNIMCVSNQDNFSGCEELLKYTFLEIFVWIVAATVMLGNIGVVIVRLFFDERGLQLWLIGSLVLSDLLMAAYLIIIGYHNVAYKGEYFEHDEEWRSSKSCTIAGVISLLSSQVSLFVMCIITLERFLSVVFPIQDRFYKLGSKSTKVIISLIWIFGLILSITPAMSERYFNEKHMKFYGQNTVCLALQLRDPEQRIIGWQYSLGLFGGLNATICLFITTAYITMYHSLRASNVETNSVRRNENISLARRMFAIVFTNLCCWLPIIVCVFLAFAGYTSTVSKVHAWTAICFFPINSTLNPILYTFYVPNIWKKLCQRLFKTGRLNEERTQRTLNTNLSRSSQNESDVLMNTKL